jgi:dimeric dUTPase (all-alpha-NTP-PPase superfamily)
MSLNLQEINKLQGELNTLIGRNTINDPEKDIWSFDYAVALHDEATELFNCCNWKWWSTEGQQDQYQRILDLPNAKIEAIDCLHFLISLIQIKDKNHFDEKENYYESVWGDCEEFLKDQQNLLANYSVELIVSSARLLDIKKNLPEDENVDDIINELMITLISVFNILGFEQEDLLRIYKMKHEKNVLRQKNGYSVINKTETDNDEIKKNI